MSPAVARRGPNRAEPFGGHHNPSRYTYRTAIYDERIVAVEGGKVLLRMRAGDLGDSAPSVGEVLHTNKVLARLSWQCPEAHPPGAALSSKTFAAIAARGVLVHVATHSLR